MNMKKKILIISLVISAAVFVSVKLYDSFALPEKNTKEDYKFVLNSDEEVSIPRYSYKTVIYQVHNTNNGKVKYGVGYTSGEKTSVVTVYEDSANPSIGLIKKNGYKYIKLRIDNTGDKDDTVKLYTILGYENGGDLIVPEGINLITQNYTDTNYYLSNSNIIIDDSENNSHEYFYIKKLSRNKIESIKFTKLSEMPDGEEGIDISRDKDNSILLWYEDLDKNNLYEVYIGTVNGKMKLSEDSSYMFYGLENLLDLDVLSLNTEDVTSMKSMFEGLTNIKELDLSSFNTSKVTDLSNLFNHDTYLNKLNITNFDFTNVKEFVSAFDYVPRDIQITLKDCNQYHLFTDKWLDSFTNIKMLNEVDCKSE